MFNDIYRGKRVLVTGHSGFKGSWLTMWLGRLGAELCGVSLPPVEMAYGLSVVTRFSETERYIFVFNSLPREQVCRLIRPLEADYGIGELAGQTLRLPAKGFQILHERREG